MEINTPIQGHNIKATIKLNSEYLADRNTLLELEKEIAEFHNTFWGNEYEDWMGVCDEGYARRFFNQAQFIQPNHLEFCEDCRGWQHPDDMHEQATNTCKTCVTLTIEEAKRQEEWMEAREAKMEAIGQDAMEDGE